MFWSQHLRCWGQNTSRIQNKEVYATLYLQVSRQSFIRGYEEFCVQNRLTIDNVAKKMDTLEELDLYAETRIGDTEELFVRLQFFSPSDVRPVNEQPSPGETSLDQFIDSEVRLTPFDTDAISIDMFRSRYETFIDKHQLVEIPITPRIMSRYVHAFAPSYFLFLATFPFI